MRPSIAASLIAGLMLLSACGTSEEASTAGAPPPTTLTPPSSGVDRGVNTAVGLARPGSQEDLAQTVGDRVFFDFDRYELSPDARRTVEGWAGWLKKYPAVNATVEGHTDERGTREYNLALGERRAIAVRDYLTALGIGSGRLRTISYGKERPAVTGSNEAAWAQNRRAMLIVQ